MKKIIYTILKILSKWIVIKYNPKVIGVTGSVGKTATKEAIHTVLAGDFKVRSTQKSYNNEIGLPLTVIGASAPGRNIIKWIGLMMKAFSLLVFKKKYPEILVLEMGADHPGDIKYLTNIAPCYIGILTNIAPTHLEYFHTTKDILKEKQIIVTHIPEDGWAVFNHDDSLLLENLPEQIKVKTLTYGLDGDSDVRIFDIKHKTTEKNGLPVVEGLQGKLTYNDSTVPFHLPGVLAVHFLYAVLAAATVGIIFDINLVTITDRLRLFQTPNGRLKLLEGKKKTWLIDDSYNSSPEAAKAALTVLADFPRANGAKTIAILGDMRELGDYSKKAHREVGQLLAELNIDYVFTFGPESVEIDASALEAGMPIERIQHMNSHDEIIKVVEDLITVGDVILVKGSQNTIRLEKVVKRLMSHPEDAEQLLVRQGSDWE